MTAKKDETTKEEKTLAAGKLLEATGTDPAIHAGAMRLAGRNADSQLTAVDYKRVVDRFLKSRPDAKRR